MGTTFGDRLMYIGGEFVASEHGEWMESVNPSTEEVHGRVPAGTVEDVNRAVAAAKTAQAEWSAKSVFERGALMRELAAAIRASEKDVVPMEAADTGNTIASLGNDIVLVAGYVDFMAGLGTEIKGESVPATPQNIHFTMREPFGVVGRIVEMWIFETCSGCFSATSSMSMPPMSLKISTGSLRRPSQVTPT